MTFTMGAAHPQVSAAAPQLDGEAFVRAFPFYLQVDANLTIVGMGPSLKKLLGAIPLGTPLEAVFKIDRPSRVKSWNDWHARAHELWMLATLDEKAISLRGSCEKGPDDTMLMLIAPALQVLAEENQHDLSFSDFARHDSSADALILTQTCRMSAQDAERLARRLRDRTEQLSSILELSNNGVIFFDSSLHVLHVNSALLQMTGLDLPTALGATLEQIDNLLVNLSDVKKGQDARYARPLKGMRDAIETKDGVLLQIQAPRQRVVQIEHARTSDDGSVFYFRDITHATEVDRMKTEFLSSAAHELRTPMVSIFGFTELLLKRSYSPERQADMLQTIHRQSGLLVNMINELLDLARIEARRGLDMNIQPMSLRKLLDDTIQGLMLADDKRKPTLHPVPALSVRADAQKMQLALTNLLGNAFKYSPDGGSVDIQVAVSHQGSQRFATVAVKDEGIGMAPHQLARAFERFYRADHSGNIPGTGLGLCLVKEIAELHQGKVQLESELGQGTTATLWIPLAD